MNIQEAQALAPEGWELIKFDHSGSCVFKRNSHRLTRTRSGIWQCTAQIADDREACSENMLTANAAINDCRAIMEYRRVKLFEALRECK